MEKNLKLQDTTIQVPNYLSDKGKGLTFQEFLKSDLAKVLLTIFLLTVLFLVAFILSFITIQKKRQEAALSGSEIVPEANIKLPEVSPTPDPTVNWKKFINTKYKYEVLYPLDWKINYFPGYGQEPPESSTGVNFRQVDDQIPAESGYTIVVDTSTNESLGAICKNLKAGEDFGGILCGDNSIIKQLNLDGVVWEKVENNSVGFVPTGFVRYATVHNNFLYYIVDYSGTGLVDQIVKTFKFTN